MSRKKQLEELRNKTKLIMKGNPNGYFKTDTKISFKATKNSVNYKKVQESPLFPTFNCDKKFYTPAFVLPHIDPLRQQQLRILHQHKVEQSLKQLQADEILVPKPRSKHRYCGVCRQYYEEYLDHIKSEKHCGSLEQSKYQKIINALCEQFQIKHPEQELQSLEKNHSFETKQGDEENSTQSFDKQHQQQQQQKIQSFNVLPVSF